MNPQIMKAEGAGERDKMLRLCEYESKYSFLLLSIVAIPLIAEMDAILTFWLGNVPEYSVMFCRCVLIVSLCDQLSIGLTSANQAIGQLRLYSLVFYTLKLIVLILAWICLRNHLPLISIMYCYISVELLTSLLRLPLMKRIANIQMWQFCKNVFGRVIIPVVCIAGACYIVPTHTQAPHSIFYCLLASGLTGFASIWFTSLTSIEKDLIRNFIKKTAKVHEQ